MWRYVVGRLVPTFRGTVLLSSSKVRQSKSEVLLSSEISEATHPTTQCHIQEDLNLHEYLCENLVRRYLINIYKPTN
jgi:hypothetical protein